MAGNQNGFTDHKSEKIFSKALERASSYSECRNRFFTLCTPSKVLRVLMNFFALVLFKFLRSAYDAYFRAEGRGKKH